MTDSDIQEIFKEADTFVLAFKAILLKASDVFETDFRCTVSLGYAANVNHAFAFELYLKCLIAIEGKLIQFGHNLEITFNNLTEETKNKIINRFTNNNPNHISINNIVKGVNKPSDFLELISSVPQPFKSLRYLFEDKEKRYLNYELEEAIYSVRETILELKPKIEGYF